MRAYSQDLRERALATLDLGEDTQAEVAERFGIHKSTLDNWWYRRRDSGSCAAVRQRHGPKPSLADCDAFIRAEIQRQPDATLAELCTRVAEVKGVPASASMMCRELQRLQLPRKKSRSTPVNARRRG
jgi:transposase